MIRKRFGQHFLQDKNYLLDIIEVIAAKPSEHLVEIGPGRGALTQFLIPSHVACLDLIEIDRDLCQHLQKRYQHIAGIRFYQADATVFDFASLTNAGEKLRVFGNLPYNVSTPLIFQLLNYVGSIADMHFLLQKELVDRLTAKVGSSHYSRLTVSVQRFCACHELFHVPASAFYPPPQVESTFVKLLPKEKPLSVANSEDFDTLLREAFCQRRKQIHNNLKAYFSIAELEALNIDPKSRPQELSIEDYITLANYISVHDKNF